MLSEDSDPQPIKLTKMEILLKGTIIALIVTVPSLTTFALVWIIFDSLITGIILGGIIHFIAMGFSLKISKRLLAKSR